MALQKLGKYEIRSELGRGAMGVVYKAYDPILEREVALKTMMASMGALDGESKSRFYREARSAAKLTHRNIVTIYDMGEEEGVPYIAMEYLDGIDLHRKIKFGGPLPLREGLEIMSQVLHGLHYAHNFQIVHRDIKPANIYILRNGTAKILDFGIAKLASSEMTRTGMVLGTVDYMSPEQIRADKAVDGRSDLFSAGVILYEFIAGRRPFPGETITSVMYKIVHEPPPELPGEREIPEALAAVVRKALAKTPAERYLTGNDFAAAIEAVIGEIDAAIPTMRIDGTEGDSHSRLKSARRLFDSGSFEDSVAVLRSVLDQDPDNTEAAQLMNVVEKRASGDVTMILEPDDAPSPGSSGSSIEEILEEVEQERRQTTDATGPRSEAGARDLTMRLSDSDIGSGERPAPGTGATGSGDQGGVQATEMLESPEPAAPPTASTPPGTGARDARKAEPLVPAGGIPPTAAWESPEEKPPAGDPPSRGATAGAGVARTAAAGAKAPPAVDARPAVIPPPARPTARARGLSPAAIGIAAVVIVTALAGGWMLFGRGEPGTGSESPAVGTEPPAPVEPPPSPSPAPVAAGFISVDAQPWAEIVRVRNTATGEDAGLGSMGDTTTPLVLELPRGTYEITLKHPDLGELTVSDLRVSSGRLTPVSRTMPGFTFDSKLPSAR
jgi:serine/threonine protein kinase